MVSASSGPPTPNMQYLHVMLQAQGGEDGNTSESRKVQESTGASGPNASHTSNVSNAVDQKSSTGKTSYYTIGIRESSGVKRRHPHFLLGTRMKKSGCTHLIHTPLCTPLAHTCTLYTHPAEAAPAHPSLWTPALGKWLESLWKTPQAYANGPQQQPPSHCASTRQVRKTTVTPGPGAWTRWSLRRGRGSTPPPLRKHGQGQKNNGHTGSPCLDKPVLARDVQHKETLHTGNLPVPHTKHITHKHGTRTQRVGKIQHGPHVLTAHQRVWNRNGNPFQPRRRTSDGGRCMLTSGSDVCDTQASDSNIFHG